MSEVECSPIVILSEDDDDDDDIIVLKEERAPPLTVSDSADDDEVIFIAHSSPSTSLKNMGTIKPESGKDITRSLSITTAFNISLTLGGPLDLSKHGSEYIGQSLSPSSQTKIIDSKEVPLVDLATDPVDLADDILGSVGSSLDSSFIETGSPAICSDDSQSSLPHTPPPDWSLKWNAPDSISSTKSSILGSISSSDSSSTLDDDDELWEILKPLSDNQGSTKVVHSLVPASPKMCDITKPSSITTDLSAAGCSDVSSTAMMPTSPRCTNSNGLSPGSGVQQSHSANISPSVSLPVFPNTNDINSVNVDFYSKPQCATTMSVAKTKAMIMSYDNLLCVSPPPIACPVGVLCPSSSAGVVAVSPPPSVNVVANSMTSVYPTSSMNFPAITSTASSIYSSILPPSLTASYSSMVVPNSGLGLGSSASKLSQNSLPLRKRVRPDLSKVVSPSDVQLRVVKDICVNCKCVLQDLKVSRCSQAHPVCAMCLEEQVKLILTDKQGSLKCILTTCDSYYPMSELKHTLPAMVVEILEDKLHKDYINFVADMIMPETTGCAHSSTSTKVVHKGAIDLSKLDGVGADESKKIKLDYEVDVSKKSVTTPTAEILPPWWDEIDTNFPQNQCIVMLEPGSFEYSNIAIKVHDTLSFPQADIINISRVQSPILWKYYQLKRTEMIRDNDGHEVEERQLFHGTNGSVVEAICRKGFDWRVCGKHGCVYGQGSYFAKAASYSHQYTERPPASATHFQQLSIRLLNHLTQSINHQQGPPFNAYGSRLQNLASFLVQPPLHNLPNPTLVMNKYQGSSSSSSTNNKPASGSVDQSNLQKHMPPTSSQWNFTANPNCQTFVMAGPSAVPQLPTSSSSSSNNTAVNLSAFISQQQSVTTPTEIYREKSSKDAKSRLISVSDIAASSTRKIFLAKVLVGKYTGGTSTHRKPPPFYPHEPYGKCYDSCVDNIWDPKIFVIFDSNQAYPEYIVEYNLVND